MFNSPVRFVSLLALSMLLASVSQVRAQQSVTLLPEINVYIASDNINIKIHHKVGPQPIKVPVLLIHGTWGNANTWDLPGRSVMDYLAVRGYDVYAVDLRGMGDSDNPGYANIDIFNRVHDATAAANYIKMTTGRRPVVMGWSQGGFIAGLLAASDPNGQLIAGVGLLSVSPNGFMVPQFPDIQASLGTILSTGAISFLPTPHEVNEIVFGTDPITGKPTISADALSTFVSVPQFLELDSVKAVLEEVDICPILLGSPNACPMPNWSNIHVPVLVVDGALDPLVGAPLATALYKALGSTSTQLVIFPRNSHGWFLEDNHDATVSVFDQFLSQF